MPPKSWKVGVERADGLAAGEVPGDVAPDEQAAQRDDEGRDRQIADQPAVKGADDRAGQKADQDRHRRDQRVFKPEAQPLRRDQRLVIAIIAEQVASSEPTERSMLRVTITKTMPVAMIATETVWIVRLKMLRGVRNRPSVSTVEHQAQHDEGADHAQQAGVDLELRQRGSGFSSVSVRLSVLLSLIGASPGYKSIWGVPRRKGRRRRSQLV
jgi:hypothetical protein